MACYITLDEDFDSTADLLDGLDTVLRRARRAATEGACGDDREARPTPQTYGACDRPFVVTTRAVVLK